jgi:hypothetical protein
MQLSLTDAQVETFRDLLLAYLPELEREVARTEQHTLRHSLVERQELVELLLVELGTPHSDF